MKVQSLAIVLTIVLMVATGAFADVPTQINFQGMLTDTSDNPITGTRSMRFFIYADMVGGSPLWSTNYDTVYIVDGLFRVILGSVASLPASMFDGSTLWLAIQVAPDLSPFEQRQPLNTVPYSFRSLDADYATSSDSAEYASYSDTAGYAVSGVGLSLPYSGSASSTGDVFSVTNTATTYFGAAIYGERTSLGSYGYLGGTYGVYGEYGNGNKGYMGSSNYGVYGSHQSTGNYGDLGDADYGVYGRHGSGNDGYIGSDQFGVYGQHDGSANWGYLGGASLGAYGKHTSNNNYGQLGASSYGVYGYGNGTDRRGVQGAHSNGNFGYLGGELAAIYGENATNGNYGSIASESGVIGVHTTSNNYGELGTDSAGVYAYSSSSSNEIAALRAHNTGYGDAISATVTSTGPAAAAVHAEATAATPLNVNAIEGINYGAGNGVYAKSTGGGYALRTSGDSYLDGNVRVRDTLTVDDGIRGLSDSLVVHGDLNVTGGYYGFPRPAFDSGWFYVTPGDEEYIQHYLSGDPDDYVVDMMAKDNDGYDIHNRGIGKDIYDDYLAISVEVGAYWRDLTSYGFSVYRGGDDSRCDSLRVRIWVIK